MMTIKIGNNCQGNGRFLVHRGICNYVISELCGIKPKEEPPKLFVVQESEGRVLPLKKIRTDLREFLCVTDFVDLVFPIRVVQIQKYQNSLLSYFRMKC